MFDLPIACLTVVMSLSSMMFVAGFHNIDLAWNMSNAPDCMDYNGHIYQDKDQMYRSGTNMQFIGVMGIMLSIMFLAVHVRKTSKSI